MVPGSTPADAEVAVVGGGIGGLAAACALRRYGVQARVFEQARRIGDVGSALTLWPNAIAALDRIGLGDDVRAAGQLCRYGQHRNRGGRPLGYYISPATLAAAHGDARVISRATLVELLLARLEPDIVQLDHRFRGYQQDDEGAPTEVTATFANGNRVKAKLLVGADGIHSTVRERICGPTTLRYAGAMAWLGIGRLERPQEGDTLFWGRGELVGVFPMTRNRAYWFAMITAPRHHTWPDPPAELRRRFEAWAEPVGSLVSHSRAEDLIRIDLHDLPPLPRWSDGRVTLLGDAAHPTTPYLGQGGCQALEDAVVLAEQLHNADDPADALAAYERRRRGRTALVTRMSRAIGTVSQWRHPLACRLRDALLRVTTPLSSRGAGSLFHFDA
jgi:2-polyprenyl-6-methoxyphenol hydroxylase-like FAD-dependent oxidoreductase